MNSTGTVEGSHMERCRRAGFTSTLFTSSNVDIQSHLPLVIQCVGDSGQKQLD